MNHPIILPQYIQEINFGDIVKIIKICYSGDSKVLHSKFPKDEYNYIKSKLVVLIDELSRNKHSIELLTNKVIATIGGNYDISLIYKYSPHDQSLYVHMKCASNTYFIAGVTLNPIKLKCVKTLVNQVIKLIINVNKLIVAMERTSLNDVAMKLSGYKPIMSIGEQLNLKFQSEKVHDVVGYKLLTNKLKGQIFNKLVSELDYVTNGDKNYQLTLSKSIGLFFEFHNRKTNITIGFKMDDYNIRVSYVYVHGSEVLKSDKKYIAVKYESVSLARHAHLRDNVAKILVFIESVHEKINLT